MLPDRFHTARLVLRPIAAADAGTIFETYATDAAVTRFLTWRPHRGRADADAYVAQCLATPPQRARTYVLTDAQSDAVRGAFDLRLQGGRLQGGRLQGGRVQGGRVHGGRLQGGGGNAGHRVEFGYVLARAWWGQGLMTEVLTEVAAWALAQPAIWRIGAVCDVENIGSARVMEKAGLVREGRLRRWLVHPNIGDEPRDCFLYAKVR
jgi:ribosomal-protein-alanine N-acetyltransferase